MQIFGNAPTLNVPYEKICGVTNVLPSVSCKGGGLCLKENHAPCPNQKRAIYFIEKYKNSAKGSKTIKKHNNGVNMDFGAEGADKFYFCQKTPPIVGKNSPRPKNPPTVKCTVIVFGPSSTRWCSHFFGIGCSFCVYTENQLI